MSIAKDKPSPLTMVDDIRIRCIDVDSSKAIISRDMFSWCYEDGLSFYELCDTDKALYIMHLNSTPMYLLVTKPLTEVVLYILLDLMLLWECDPEHSFNEVRNNLICEISPGVDGNLSNLEEVSLTIDGNYDSFLRIEQ